LAYHYTTGAKGNYDTSLVSSNDPIYTGTSYVERLGRCRCRVYRQHAISETNHYIKNYTRKNYQSCYYYRRKIAAFQCGCSSMFFKRDTLRRRGRVAAVRWVPGVGRVGWGGFVCSASGAAGVLPQNVTIIHKWRKATASDPFKI